MSKIIMAFISCDRHSGSRRWSTT